MIELGKAKDLSPRVGHEGMKFRSPEDGTEFMVRVYDKFPEMGDVHVEGRRYVEVSTEMFMYLMQKAGFLVVNPMTNNVVIPEVKEEEE